MHFSILLQLKNCLQDIYSDQESNITMNTRVTMNTEHNTMTMKSMKEQLKGEPPNKQRNKTSVNYAHPAINHQNIMIMVSGLYCDKKLRSGGPLIIWTN